MARKSRRDKTLYSSVRRKIRTRVGARARSLIRLRSLRKMKYGKYRVRHGKIVNVGSNPRRSNLGSNMIHALSFAYKYPGWHSYDRLPSTDRAIKNLSKRGLVEISKISRQFKITEKGKAYAYRSI